MNSINDKMLKGLDWKKSVIDIFSFIIRHRANTVVWISKKVNLREIIVKEYRFDLFYNLAFKKIFYNIKKSLAVVQISTFCAIIRSFHVILNPQKLYLWCNFFWQQRTCIIYESIKLGSNFSECIRNKKGRKNYFTYTVSYYRNIFGCKIYLNDFFKKMCTHLYT